jgi:hypothetical protein
VKRPRHGTAKLNARKIFGADDFTIDEESDDSSLDSAAVKWLERLVNVQRSPPWRKALLHTARLWLAPGGTRYGW